jgi:DNA-binding transcriptional LysR family regulator
MEWDDIKYFLAVARLGSLTKAAHTFQTTPATVGRRVATLEAKLGTRLFDRKHTGYTLTENGEAIIVKAEEAEDAILSVERKAIGRDQRVTGNVRLTTTDDIAALVLAPHLSRFTKLFPDVSLEIVACDEVINLATRKADIALRTVRPARGEVIIRQAGWWNLGLYAAKSYAKAHALRPGATDFSSVDVINWTEETAHFRGGPWLAEHARQSRIAFTANSRRIHYAACKAGMGLAILPCIAADRDLDLMCLLPPKRVISVKLWLVVHRDLVQTARVRLVMDFIAKIGPKQEPQ